MRNADTRRVHGGSDALGTATYDFSTNGNACGPCPHALDYLRQANSSRYPDASYQALRERLADFHRVETERIVLAGSASEFMFRITALAVQRGIRHVHVPRHAYGDYGHAAAAWGLTVSAGTARQHAIAEGPRYLSWACDPSNPLGDAHFGLAHWVHGCAKGHFIGIIDRVYEPLRLDGELGLPAPALDDVWQLFSPNKALGLTGVRAAYAVAPTQSSADVQALESLCPSWPVGADGVALLQAWCDPDAQAWLVGARETLRRWKAAQQRLCIDFGWTVRSSQTNFFCAAPRCADHELRVALIHLREHGIKVRDATSFGLPGLVRLAVLAPDAQDVLGRAWRCRPMGKQPSSADISRQGAGFTHPLEP